MPEKPELLMFGGKTDFGDEGSITQDHIDVLIGQTKPTDPYYSELVNLRRRMVPLHYDGYYLATEQGVNSAIRVMHAEATARESGEPMLLNYQFMSRVVDEMSSDHQN